MPCTAKKVECNRKQLAVEGVPDTDYVLTTQELGRMIKEAGIDFKNLAPETEDNPFGGYTGAATIFGASGGVAEAAARTAYELVTGKELTDVNLKPMRGVNASERSKEMELDLDARVDAALTFYENCDAKRFADNESRYKKLINSPDLSEPQYEQLVEAHDKRKTELMV